MKFDFVIIGESELPLLGNFIMKLGQAGNTFRYFATRSTQVIYNHLVTIGLVSNNEMVGYGHLDVEDSIVWLGIAVLPEFQGNGFGKIILNELIRIGKEKELKEIYLTVDVGNVKAIELYRQFRFVSVSKTESYIKMCLHLN